jgi:hypothetical protein
MAALVVAFLMEIALYLLPGFDAARAWLMERYGKWTLACLLVASAVAPYAVYSAPAGLFRWQSCAVLAALAIVAALWFVVLPRHPLADALFLVLVGAVVLGQVFPAVYASPLGRTRIDVLGDLMWRRLAILAVLFFRPLEGVGFGFLPRKRDWLVGVREFLFFLPLAVVLALALDLARFQPVRGEWWKVAGVAVGTFLGMLWVVALFEEFLFRGLLQQWLGEWMKSTTAGLIAASLIFGAVHLPFRAFPNWKFAILAAVAGVFYGRAFQKAGNIRAAMATHALVNTTWRMLFN